MYHFCDIYLDFSASPPYTDLVRRPKASPVSLKQPQPMMQATRRSVASS